MDKYKILKVHVEEIEDFDAYLNHMAQTGWFPVKHWTKACGLLKFTDNSSQRGYYTAIYNQVKFNNTFQKMEADGLFSREKSIQKADHAFHQQLRRQGVETAFTYQGFDILRHDVPIEPFSKPHRLEIKRRFVNNSLMNQSLIIAFAVLYCLISIVWRTKPLINVFASPSIVAYVVGIVVTLNAVFRVVRMVLDKKGHRQPWNVAEMGLNNSIQTKVGYALKVSVIAAVLALIIWVLTPLKVRPYFLWVLLGVVLVDIGLKRLLVRDPMIKFLNWWYARPIILSIIVAFVMPFLLIASDGPSTPVSAAASSHSKSVQILCQDQLYFETETSVIIKKREINCIEGQNITSSYTIYEINTPVISTLLKRFALNDFGVGAIPDNQRFEFKEKLNHDITREHYGMVSKNKIILSYDPLPTAFTFEGDE